MIMDKSSRSLKHKLNHQNHFSDIQNDHNSMDPFEEDEMQNKTILKEPTIGSVGDYCQKCFSKSIEKFQINFEESIQLCVNPNCVSSNTSFGSRISYTDPNNNESTNFPDENDKPLKKRFKYSEDILKLNSKELSSLFETNFNGEKFYTDVETVFNGLIQPQASNIEPNLNEILAEKIQGNISSSLITTKELLGTDSDNINDQFDEPFHENNPIIDKLQGQEQSLLTLDHLMVDQSQNMNRSSTQSQMFNGIPMLADNTFDDDFFSFLNDENNQLLNNNVNINNNNHNMIQTVDTFPNDLTFNFNQEQQITQIDNLEQDDLAGLLTDEFLLTPQSNSANDNKMIIQQNINDFVVIPPIIPHNTSNNNNNITAVNTQQPITNIIGEQSFLDDQLFDIISETKTKLGYGIKITKPKKVKKPKVEVQKFNLELQLENIDENSDKVEINVPIVNKSKIKYDSIGENEDSGSNDNLLPWEIKSKKRYKQDKNKKKISNLELMSNKTQSPSKLNSPLIQIPKSVSKADLSMRKTKDIEKGTSFKESLSAQPNQKISDLFSKSNLVNGSPSASYKDLVLNVLKKKTKI